MGLASDFGLLFLLDARDRAEATIKKADAYLNKFAGTAERTGAAAKAAGDEIDSSFLKTASGADALEVASARVAGAQEKQRVATEELAAAERELLAVRAKESPDAGELAAATDKLAAADKRAATASKELSDAEKLQSDTARAAAAKTGEATAKTDLAAASASKGKSALDGLGKTAAAAGLGVVLAGGFMAKGAADFQSSTTVLQTSGGETATQMAQVRAGILNLSSGTGTALKPLVDGMYMIGSAGYTGSAGLRVLQAAAQGAKAEGADLGTVSNALTTAMKDYGVSAKDAGANQQISNAYMDQMIAIVQNGKTTTEDLAASLSNVLPIASAVGLSFSQVGGAMATMTGAGESAQQSSQNLANTIRSLESPNAVAVKEMQQMGLNSTNLAKNLGKVGLAGTIKEMTDAIQQHMGPAGTVAVNAFQNSAAAAQNVQQIMSKLPASVQQLAKSYLDGSVSSKQWKQDLQNLDPITAHLMQQFGQAADQTHQFNSMLTSGNPAQQTAAQALQKMMGGATGLNVALMLSANNYKTVTANTKAVAEAAKGAGQNVDGWSEIQSNFSQKMAQAKQSIEVTGISIGTALLPAMTSLLQHVTRIIEPIASWTQKHQKATVEILGTAAGLGLLIGAINLGVKAYRAVKSAIEAVSTVVSKIIGLFGGAAGAQDAAAVSSDAAAASADGLAVSEDAAATATAASTVATDENALATDRSALASAAAAIKTGLVTAAQKTAAVAAGAWREAQAALHVVIQSTIESLDNFTALLNGASGAEDAAAVSADGAAASADGLAASEDGAAASTEASTVAQDANSGSLIRSGLTAVGTAAKYLIMKAAQTAVLLATKAWMAAQIAFNAVMDANPIILVVTAIAALAAGVIYAYTHFQAFRDIVEAVWNWLKGAVVDTIGFVKDHWELIVDIFTGPIGIVSTQIYDHWQTIKRWFSDGVHDVESVLSWFGSLPGKFWGWLSSTAASIGRGIAQGVSWFIGWPGRVETAIYGYFSGLAGKFGDWMGGVYNSIKQKGADAIQWFKGLPGKILDALGNLDRTLWDAGVSLIEGFIDGIGSMFDKVKDTLGNLTSKLTSWKGPPGTDAVLLTANGKLIIQGLVAGFDQEIPQVQAKLQGLTANIQSAITPTPLPALPTAGPGATSSGATVININNNFSGAHVTGDQDMELLAQKVSAAVARILPTGGLRVAM